MPRPHLPDNRQLHDVPLDPPAHNHRRPTVTAPTHPIEEGALVRLSRELTEQELEWFGARLRLGEEFVIEEFLPVAGNPDPEPDDIPVDFYYGSANGGTVTAPADAIEVVKTAAQMDARKPPTARQILDEIGGELLNDFDGFRTDETEPDGDGRTVYGRTDDGLPFGFTIKVTAIWETDL